jgi:hypothetical protein
VCVYVCVRARASAVDIDRFRTVKHGRLATLPETVKLVKLERRNDFICKKVYWKVRNNENILKKLLIESFWMYHLSKVSERFEHYVTLSVFSNQRRHKLGKQEFSNTRMSVLAAAVIHCLWQ